MKRLALCLFAVVLCLTALTTPTQAGEFPPPEYLSCFDLCCPESPAWRPCSHDGVATTCGSYLKQNLC